MACHPCTGDPATKRDGEWLQRFGRIRTMFVVLISVTAVFLTMHLVAGRAVRHSTLHQSSTIAGAVGNSTPLKQASNMSIGPVVTPLAVNTDPTTVPTVHPTIAPTTEPTTEPTAEPTTEPTAEPTAEPTSSPTETPTAPPSAEPSAAPSPSPTCIPTTAPTTSGPTVSPTTSAPSRRPTPAPSSAPTKGPTSAPTTRPSKSPTRTPSCRPSSAPTRQPTPLPGRPTTTPTIETSVPTASPTEDPFPFQTELTFNCDLAFVGIDRFTFLDDPNVAPAVVKAFALTMNVTENEVEIVDVIDISTARRQLRAHDAHFAVTDVHVSNAHTQSDAAREASTGDTHTTQKSVLASGIQVTMQVLVVLEKLGYITSEDTEAYNTLSDLATAAVQGGHYGTLLNEILTELGAIATLTPNVNSLSVGVFSSAVTKTPVPSIQPTVSPTATPTVNSAREGSRHKGGTTVVDIIIIVTVVGTSLLLVSLIVSAYYETELKNKRKVGPDPSLAVVPG